ncbi:MAG: YhdP family protein [Gammaproteobacteria bacterium]
MKLLRFLISSLWLSLATLIIVIGLLLSAARLLLPELGQYHDEAAAWVGDVLGQPVKIGALAAGWRGLGPSLELRDVAVLDAAGKQVVLQCASASLDINLWESLRQWQFEPGQLTVRGLRLAVVRHADGGIHVMGLKQAAAQSALNVSGANALEQWLQHQARLSIRDSALEWRDLGAQGRTWEFSAVNLQLRNQDDRHRVDGTVDLPASLGRHLQVAVDVRGDLFAPRSWVGQVYARGDALRLGEWWGGRARSGVAALGGVADFRAWSTWSDGVQRVDGDVHVDNLRVTRDTADLTADAAATAPAAPAPAMTEKSVAGGFRWQRRAAGWAVDIDQFVIGHAASRTPPAQLRVQYAEDKAGGRKVVQAAYSKLRAEDVADVLQAAQVLPAAFRQRLAAMALHGTLSDGYLRYQNEPQHPPRFLFHSRFNDLVWQAVAPAPGVEGMTGSITADNEQGVVTFATGQARLDFSALFRGPLPVDGLAGDVYWRRRTGGWRVRVHDLAVHNEDVKMKVAGYVDKQPGDATPYLDMTASFDDGKADHVSRYLPAKIIPPHTLHWLDRAIVNGRISGGRARIYGRLADFPFDDGRGLFEIRFDVTDGILDYANGWPRLEEVQTEIGFHGRRFEARVVSAKSLDSEIRQALVTIPDMTTHPAVLVVDGTARGPTGDAVRYVTKSPLRDKLGTYLQDVAAGGRSSLQLNLKLPLGRRVSRLRGTLQINDGSLLFKDAKVDLTHIDGSLKFSERGLSADKVHADLLGQAVTVSAKTTRAREGVTTVFSAQGLMDAAAISKRYIPLLAPYVDGVTAWHGELRIPPRSEGWVELDMSSPLQGVEVNLPPPMGKAADEARPLLVQMPLPLKTEKPIHVRYGKLADAQLVVAGAKGGLKLVRGEVRFGAGVAALPPRAGLRAVGSLPEFDATQWAAIVDKEAAAKGRGAVPMVMHVDMNFGALQFADQRLDKVHILADHGDAAWDADIRSDQVAGHIHLPDARDGPLVMTMDRLFLPRFKRHAKGESSTDPRKARPLDINAKSFHYGNLDLGELRVSATRTPAGLHFDDIHTHSAQRDLKASGQWIMADEQAQSSFKVAYNGQDAGGTLTSLGFAGMIKGGRTHTDFQLKWPGAPADFALARAMGSINLEIKDGRLLDVEPGAGRILGLLSFQALPRRLLLDFSDLFQKGFSFDTLAGSFTIEKGNAYTDNLYMEGPAARIDARGRVGLAAEDYDQRVTVIPSVSAGLPIAGALAGGVGAGAAMWLVEKLIKPGIDKITKVEYQVTGPWADPTVTRITAGGQSKQAGRIKH